MLSKERLQKIDWTLVIIPIIAVFVLSLILICYPTASQNVLQSWRSFLCSQLTPYYLVVGLIFIFTEYFILRL